MKHRIATELLSFQEVLEAMPIKKIWAEKVFSRLGSVVNLPNYARVLDIGAGAGGFLVACSELGYRCEGIEPWEDARRSALKLSEYLGIPIQIYAGTAESIPFEANIFDVVHASSVVEHVKDVEKALDEIYRVLKPGGVFWFNAASAICPRQREISGFPLFGWYPDKMKRRIMNWAKVNKPHLVGYTKMPAINWFTPSKARTLLKKHGFELVYDRWDLRKLTERGGVRGLALRMICLTRATKIFADLAVAGCSYAATKPLKYRP